jgi:hypothetical protein
MDKPSRCTPSPSVQSSVHSGGIVLLDLAMGRLFASNPTGARIWQGLTQGMPSARIAADLSQTHRVPLETAQASTMRFITQLVAHGLVRVGADR